jgi:hypothetical protein
VWDDGEEILSESGFAGLHDKQDLKVRPIQEYEKDTHHID